MIQFNRKHLIAAVLSLAILGGAYVAFQSLILGPITKQQDSYQKNIATSEELLSPTSTSGGANAILNQYSLAELQMEVPNNRFEEQLLLDLEKAETLSGSTVKSALFSDQDFTDQTADQKKEEETAAASSTAEEETSGAPAADGSSREASAGEPAADLPALPAGMKKVSITVNLESEDYSGVKRFLETLESLKRITQIESVTITNTESAVKEETADVPLKYDVIVSAYYMPDLEELKDQLPPFPHSDPGKVIDPFETPSDENIGETTE
ncbi:hypothetical protein CEF21_16660 [Bacillus sp. FJAT-42376]|uniref:hypothetical protein n=1 Tax=Bacillus sp. FJAT-42376 TaxID=2014076 RepID=UPI000F4DCB10|nr:hypothetical protein [Bacillus sp. FJAT-42376]AZB43806.1 hypothetical protein CEF21_16660 [Bacillus sp. FJAT-42376]